jgi:hypothetical protein
MPAQATRRRAIVYPSGDGRLMSESDVHRVETTDYAIEPLAANADQARELAAAEREVARLRRELARRGRG